MSDEHEHEHHFSFAFPFPVSKEELEKHQMASESSAHETRQFFMGLEEDQLKKLAGLFKAVVLSDGAAGEYYIGIISGVLDLRHNTCLACGRNHDQELGELTGHSPEAEAKPGSYTPDSDDVKDIKYLMDQYGVEPDDGGTEHVMCSNCKMWYANLEDRMRRPVGKAGCQGCIQKEKWG